VVNASPPLHNDAASAATSGSGSGALATDSPSISFTSTSCGRVDRYLAEDHGEDLLNIEEVVRREFPAGESCLSSSYSSSIDPFWAQRR
jgi:hypothetical protein